MVSCPNPQRCPVCKGPMSGRKTSACSDRCRAARSRLKKAERLRDLVAVLAREAGLRPEDFS